MAKEHVGKIAEKILRIRLSQMMVNEEYKAGKFKIPIHLSFGHEAIACAVSAIMTREDRLILSHRNIAYNLARLGLFRPVWDEYFLRPKGLAGGKLGSMNLINKKRGIIYSSSILGNNFPVSAGTAMAQKMLRPSGIAIVLSGDGAIEEGAFYEGLELLKSLNLSALVIIENNEWSLATRIAERRCPIDLAKLVRAMGIKYERLKGNDVFEYIRKLRKLRSNVLKSHSPLLVEVQVKTLGDWWMKTLEYPRGKYVNYHAGPSPSVEFRNWPLFFRKNSQDPVFVLKKYFDASALNKMSKRILMALKREVARP